MSSTWVICKGDIRFPIRPYVFQLWKRFQLYLDFNIDAFCSSDGDVIFGRSPRWGDLGFSTETKVSIDTERLAQNGQNFTSIRLLVWKLSREHLIFRSNGPVLDICVKKKIYVFQNNHDHELWQKGSLHKLFVESSGAAFCLNKDEVDF